MTEFDPEEEAVLESARRALSPPDAVTRRMRAALLVKVAAPGIAVGASAAASSAAAASAGAAAAAASATTAGSAAPLAAAAGGAVAGAKIAVGAGLLKAAAGVTTAVLLATATSPYWLSEPTPSAPPASTAASAPAAAPARATTTPTSAGRARTAPDAKHSRTAKTASSSITSPPTGIPAPAPSVTVRRTPALGETPEQRLHVELDLLKRAQQAIQAGQAGLALDLLAQLDAEHPASSLGQEREVARVLALCGAGRVAAARQVAQRVLAASPNSLYAGRIQASCAALPSKPSAQAPVASPGKSTPAAPPVARFGDSGN